MKREVKGGQEAAVVWRVTGGAHHAGRESKKRERKKKTALRTWQCNLRREERKCVLFIGQRDTPRG